MRTRQDTIAAIATAPGPGGISIVRVSGAEALSVAAGLVRGRLPVPQGCDPGAGLRTLASRGAVLDHAIVLVFRAPHSYTGEDVVEFQCHGGVVTSRRVLEACFSEGVRLARRGEFTERAFLNGKLTYEQAEGVLDLIEAKTERAADAALAGLAGERLRLLRGLYGESLEISSILEHALDVDEGELPESFRGGVEARIARLESEIADACAKIAAGRILREGALVVLAGPPNVGKSSLMNALLGESRAIVSDVPGTTRDAIEAWLDLDGWPVRMTDTAGLRETSDRLEAEGVRRTREILAKADIILNLTDGAAEGGVSAGDCRPGAIILPVRTKADLGTPSAPDALAVSARTGVGLAELKRKLSGILTDLAREPSEGQGAETLSPLFAASRFLSSARRLDDLVLKANGVRSASETLADAVGARYSADVLERLFARFCVGK